MKMIRTVIRPEKVDDVTDGLEEEGFFSLTKYNVFGRGKQKGITVGSVHYDELPKTMLMIVVDDDSVEKAVNIITEKAYTGNYGDGKVFVTDVDEAFTVRTGEKGL